MEKPKSLDNTSTSAQVYSILVKFICSWTCVNLTSSISMLEISNFMSRTYNNYLFIIQQLFNN